MKHGRMLRKMAGMMWTTMDLSKLVWVVAKYVSDLDNPLAYNIETLLGSLIKLICKDEARSMRNTTLTDFFQQL